MAGINPNEDILRDMDKLLFAEDVISHFMNKLVYKKYPFGSIKIAPRSGYYRNCVYNGFDENIQKAFDILYKWQSRFVDEKFTEYDERNCISSMRFNKYESKLKKEFFSDGHDIEKFFNYCVMLATMAKYFYECGLLDTLDRACEFIVKSFPDQEMTELSWQYMSGFAKNMVRKCKGNDSDSNSDSDSDEEDKQGGCDCFGCEIVGKNFKEVYGVMDQAIKIHRDACLSRRTSKHVKRLYLNPKPGTSKSSSSPKKSSPYNPKPGTSKTSSSPKKSNLYNPKPGTSKLSSSPKNSSPDNPKPSSSPKKSSPRFKRYFGTPSEFNESLIDVNLLSFPNVDFSSGDERFIFSPSDALGLFLERQIELPIAADPSSHADDENSSLYNPKPGTSKPSSSPKKSSPDNQKCSEIPLEYAEPLTHLNLLSYPKVADEYENESFIFSPSFALEFFREREIELPIAADPSPNDDDEKPSTSQLNFELPDAVYHNALKNLKQKCSPEDRRRFKFPDVTHEMSLQQFVSDPSQALTQNRRQSLLPQVKIRDFEQPIKDGNSNLHSPENFMNYFEKSRKIWGEQTDSSDALLNTPLALEPATSSFQEHCSTRLEIFRREIQKFFESLGFLDKYVLGKEDEDVNMYVLPDINYEFLIARQTYDRMKGDLESKDQEFCPYKTETDDGIEKTDSAQESNPAVVDSPDDDTADYDSPGYDPLYDYSQDSDSDSDSPDRGSPVPTSPVPGSPLRDFPDCDDIDPSSSEVRKKSKSPSSSP